VVERVPSGEQALKPPAIGLTRAELAAAAPEEQCPVRTGPTPGYWLGSSAQWRRRALEAEKALEVLRARLLREWRPTT
jgi:hypothetical protein